jgi:hypothetical protein
MATDSGELPVHWHGLDSEAAAARLGSDLDQGLTAGAAAARLAQAGPNALRPAGATRSSEKWLARRGWLYHAG